MLDKCNSDKIGQNKATKSVAGRVWIIGLTTTKGRFHWIEKVVAKKGVSICIAKIWKSYEHEAQQSKDRNSVQTVRGPVKETKARRGGIDAHTASYKTKKMKKNRKVKETW